MTRTKIPTIKNDEFVQQFRAKLLTGKVKIYGLGVFEMRRIPPRRGISTLTGEPYTSYNRIKFRPSVEFKHLLSLWKPQ